MPASIRKQGEGNRNQFEYSDPSPEFQELVPRTEILPSPASGEGKASYLIYNELDFDIPTGKTGDSLTRYKVRIAEMRECLKLIAQCSNWLKSNPQDVVSKIKQPSLKAPEGEFISNVEAPRGVCSCYIKSDGSSIPYRVKWRTGSFYAVQILPELLKDKAYPDLMAIFGSLDVILPEVDR